MIISYGRGNDSTGIIGVGSASQDDDDANLIAGSVDNLRLSFNNAKTIHGQMTLTLADAQGDLGGDDTDGIAIASALFGEGEELKSYAGLLSGSDLGARIDKTSGTAEWTGKIALGWQAKDATRATVFTTNDPSDDSDNGDPTDDDHNDFTLMITFGSTTNLRATNIALFGGGETGTITIEAEVASGESLVTGTTDVTVGSETVQAILRGIIGQEGVLAVFATDGAGDGTREFGAYAGGFAVASGCENNPFTSSGCSDLQKDTACLTNFKQMLFSNECSNRQSSDQQFLVNLETARNTYCAMDVNAWHIANCVPRDDQSVLDARDRVVTACTPPLSDAKCAALVATGAPSIAACATDPYQTGCGNVAFDMRRITIANTCNEDMSRAVMQCAIMIGSTTIGACADNPYLGDCGDDGFENIRTARSLFCDNRANYFSDLCNGFLNITTLRTNLCSANDSPFDPRCTNNQLERDARIAECFMGGNAADLGRCREAIVEQPCIENPFDIGCDDMARTNRLSYCAEVADFELSLCSVCLASRK